MSEQSEDDSQKTEEPTQKKLEEARKKGQTASSKEIDHWVMIMAGTLVIGAFMPFVVRDIQKVLVNFLARPHDYVVDVAGVGGILAGVGLDIIKWLTLPFAVMIAAAVLSNFVQHGFIVSAESLKPKLEKISLIKGVQRQFSLRSVMEFAKGLIKLTIVGAVAAAVVWPEVRDLRYTVRMSLGDLLELIYTLALKLMISVAAIMAAVAALDMLYQRFEFLKQMRMSRRELKDEMKQSEGDPMVKARLRQIRQERARKRMMAAVPSADVVITNPTHFAVALQYDPDKMGAPMVVAKGQDAVAQKIREVAHENNVPVVENKPLARALFATAEIDQEIPVEHYKAVAEVIGYVYRLKGKMPGSRRAG